MVELKESERWEKYNYSGLLISLLMVYLITPLVSKAQTVNILIEVAFLGILLFSILLISHSKIKTIWAVVLALPLVISNVTFLYIKSFPFLQYVMLICGCLFFGYITWIIVVEVFAAQNVDVNIIVGAVCVYLLIGIVWGFIYGLIEAFNPDSFMHMGTANNSINEFMYYSLVTLSTLGYGDIAPVSKVARAYSAIEAVVGQIYLTVLVARLVGIHYTQYLRKDNSLMQ